MSLQRRINKRGAARTPDRHRADASFYKGITKGMTKSQVNHPLKGKKDGACNRTACQKPLANETDDQFMDGNFTGGPKLYYCRHCALDFDIWDRQSGDPVRIKREPKQ